MLACQKVMILLATPRGMTESWDLRREMGVTAGALCDLGLLGRIEVDLQTSIVRVRGPQATGSPALDHVLGQAAGREKVVGALVRSREASPLNALATEMKNQGLLHRRRASILGLFPERYQVNETVDARVRATLRDVLHGAAPDGSDACVLAILDGLGVLTKVLPAETKGLSRRDLTERLSELCRDPQINRALHREVAKIGSAIPAMTV